MTFSEIFEDEGLYKANDFISGLAFKISKHKLINRLELTVIQYKFSTDRDPKIIEKFPIYDDLFKKDYRIVNNVKDLFRDIHNNENS
jgi:hypothetical protein